jgi:iron complex outermembrane recepter protein
MSTRHRIVVLALSTSLFTPATAWAQQAPSEDTSATSGADIIVNARRRDERLVDAPVAITAIGGDELKDKAITRFTDISTQVPSMVAGRAASGSAASIFLRGVGSTALSAGFDQSVSFVIDNMPMSRGREISLPQFDIQRVEVLKGPQALFFGKNTTGGLISVVSRGPTDEFEAGGRAGYGYTKFDAAIGVHGDDQRWSVSLIGRNLTNKLVVTAANDIPFTGGTGTGTTTGVVSDMSAFVENPREVFVEVAFKF